MSLDVVVGGLYGSEAKGHVVQRLVERRLNEGEHVWNIRVGGPNAGHTGHDAHGLPWAFRQIPVGVLARPPRGCRIGLEIAAGSEVDPPVLLDEIDRCLAAGLLGPGTGKYLVVHGEATLIEGHHKVTEGPLVGRIGSTGKGIGAARADRLMRHARRVIDSTELLVELDKRDVAFVTGDSGGWRQAGAAMIIEGVQGYALGLHAGFYPQCTTSDCRAIDFLSMAGVSPWDSRYVNDGLTDFKVWVVARVFPIRVAGNSGPLAGETSWEALGLPEEHTTVTKKVRRVGLPDWELVRQAVVANGGEQVRVALSMVDQMFPEVAGIPWSRSDPRWIEADKRITGVEAKVKAPVSLVLSGPNTGAFRGVWA